MRIEVADDWFELSVEDNGMGLSDTPKGNGIALQNVRDRLSGSLDMRFTYRGAKLLWRRYGHASHPFAPFAGIAAFFL